jgi:hypothetical protein
MTKAKIVRMQAELSLFKETRQYLVATVPRLRDAQVGAPFTVGQEVTVHDRYRFAIPLAGTVVRVEGISNEGVRVVLRQSNSAKYPVGVEILVSQHQLTRVAP